MSECRANSVPSPQLPIIPPLPICPIRRPFNFVSGSARGEIASSPTILPPPPPPPTSVLTSLFRPAHQKHFIQRPLSRKRLPSSVPSPEMFPPVVSHSDKINGEMEEDLQTEAQFVRLFVERHNELRELHGSPGLTVSEELCAMAKEWASKIAWQGHVSFAEMSEGKCAREMVDYWYEENRKYEYDSPGWQEGTNYFSQIIWRSTKEIGVSRLTMRAFPQPIEREKKIANGNSNVVKSVVVVAFYRPAGNSNRSGQFVLNVSKPIAH